MRCFKASTFVSALLSATAFTGIGAHAQAVNTTPANVNVLNLLSPYLNLNATAIGQTTLQDNLQNAYATNNNATPALQALAVSDKNLLGARSNTVTTAPTSTAYGPAANLAGGLPAQTTVSGTNGTITPIQAVGGLGAVLGPIFQQGVAPIGTGPNQTAMLANTATLLVSTYNFTSADLGVAKNYFADGAASNASGSAATSTPAVAPPGYTLPTANGLPNKTTSVYDQAYGVSNTAAGQDVYGSSRPVQVSGSPSNPGGGINQFDSTSISGLTTNPSFPSGHTNYAYTDSVLIAMLVPQDYQSMLLRASAYANSRIVLGVHYPLDIIASRAFSAYDLAQAFTNPLYISNAATTGTAINLPTLFNAANGELQPYLATNCGSTVAACSTSAANTANDPYLPSAANAATYAANLTYGLPTLTLAQAPQEAAPAGGPDASILLATVYGGNTAAAKTIAPNGGLDGTLSTATINQIIVNTENNALAAFYGTSLSYWTRINLYAAAGYLGNVTGTLSLAPTDIVTQNVSIASGGVLAANGTVTGATAVASGGTLAGSGTVAAVTAASGATVAPGSLAAQAALLAGATGVAGTTLASSRAVSLAPGATFAVYATPTQATALTTTGPATINGSTFALNASSNQAFVPTTRYTVLTAAGGVTGTFATTTSNLPFLTPTLSYDANDAYLQVSRNTAALVGAAQTGNQRNVAYGLSQAANVPTGVAGTAVLQAIFNQTSAGQARATFDTLSGEGITAAQNAAHRSVSEFTSTIFDQTTVFEGAGSGNSITLSDGPAPIRELADLPSAAHQPVAPLAPQRTWRAWATGFGGVETIRGNAGLGSAGQSDTIYGGTLGVDYQIAPNYLAGIAIGGSDGEFDVTGRATSGSTTGGHIAFYDLATFGAFYGASSTSASFFTNRTTRNVAGFAGLAGETDRGNFDSHEFRTRLGVGRHIGGLGGILTPFVALEIAELRSNGFAETNLAGPTVLGLTVQGQDQASVPSFVGARYQGVTALGNGMLLSPSVQVAYVHEFAPERTQIGGLTSLPASTFLVDGARPSRNAAQVKAGADLAIGPHSSLFATFDGEVSGQAQFYGGKGGVRYVW